jgi:hypothetical protein
MRALLPDEIEFKVQKKGRLCDFFYIERVASLAHRKVLKNTFQMAKEGFALVGIDVEISEDGSEVRLDP